MKDWIAAGLALAALGIMFGPLLLARHSLVKRHREQFLATGSPAFDLPSARSFEAPDEPAQEEASPVAPMAIVDTETGEVVRLGADGMPLSEADLSARTPSTSLTVDTQRLAEILKMEKTGEYPYDAAMWAEDDAAEHFRRDPLGSAVLPPMPLVEAAGNPALAESFYSLYDKGSLTTDWSDADSAFKFWDSDVPLRGAEDEELAAMVDAYRVEVTAR